MKWREVRRIREKKRLMKDKTKEIKDRRRNRNRERGSERKGKVARREEKEMLTQN